MYAHWGPQKEEREKQPSRNLGTQHRVDERHQSQ